jgi:hypothetical protein
LNFRPSFRVWSGAETTASFNSGGKERGGKGKEKGKGESYFLYSSEIGVRGCDKNRMGSCIEGFKKNKVYEIFIAARHIAGQIKRHGMS